VAYTEMLDFFPWGNNNAYVIWGILLIYVIIPSFFAIGIAKIILAKWARSIYSVVLFMEVAVIIMIPPLIGFDYAEDMFGRWAGVITSLIAIALITIDIVKSIQNFVFLIKKSD
jgi:hypothetical protein